MQVLGLQYYIGTAAAQLLGLGDDNFLYTTLLVCIVPLGALGTPVFGWLMSSRGFGMTFFVINAMGMITNGLAAIPLLPLQVVTFVIWGLYRVLLFSAVYALVAYAFAFRHFGKLSGLCLCVCGVVGLAQVAITAFVSHVLNDDFFYVNIAFVILRIPLFLICVYVKRTAPVRK